MKDVIKNRIKRLEEIVKQRNEHQVACPDRNPRTGGLIPTPTGLTGGHRIKEPARRTALYQGNGQVKIRTSILW
jgi:hypothetical protein